MDLFDHPDYPIVRNAVQKHFPAFEIFEPARCNWSTSEWLRAWPRLLRRIEVLVIWPRSDKSIGWGVYTEACDVEQIGNPVFVIAPGGGLKSLLGFKLINSGPRQFARVLMGARKKTINLQGGD